MWLGPTSAGRRVVRGCAFGRGNPKFQRVMGTYRSFEQLQESYFLGTTNEVIDRIGELERLGFEYLLLGTVDQDLEQLQRIAAEIMPHFGSA